MYLGFIFGLDFQLFGIITFIIKIVHRVILSGLEDYSAKKTPSMRKGCKEKIDPLAKYGAWIAKSTGKYQNAGINDPGYRSGFVSGKRRDRSMLRATIQPSMALAVQVASQSLSLGHNVLKECQ